MSESLAGWQIPESAQVPLRPVTKTDLAYLQIRQKILECERLVISRAHRNRVVAPLSLPTMEEVFSVRLSLDPLAASLAAAHADDSERERIRALSRNHPPEDDPVTSVHFNRRLHRSIYAACRNSTLVEILDSLWDLSDRYRLIISKSAPGLAMARDEHPAIVSAVT